MKKGILFAIPLLISSCMFLNSCDADGRYELRTVDHHDLLENDIAGWYKAGDKIEVHLAFRSGPKVSCLIDGMEYEADTFADGEESFVYTMPSKDVTLYTMLNGHTGLEKTMDLSVSYDYGLHVPNVATKLFGYSLMSFEEPEIARRAIAGDVLRLFYLGEIKILETYPSQVVYSDDFRFVSLTFVKKAELVEIDPKGVVIDPEKEEYVLLDSEGNFESLGDYLQKGKKLYASKDSETGEIHAYYGYEVRKCG